MPPSTRRASRLLWAGLAVCVLLAGSTPVARAGDDDDLIVLTLASEEVEMEAFLRTVSKATRTPMLWNPINKNIRASKIIGRVQITMPRSELWNTVRSLLIFYELELIPVGPTGHRVWLVASALGYRTLARRKPKLVRLTDTNLAKYEHADGLFISAVLHVEHPAILRLARGALTRIVTGQTIGFVEEIPEVQALLVTDYAPRVVACYRLIKALAKPQVEPSTTDGRTTAIALQHANVTALGQALQAHFPDQRITADARTNRLLVTGTDAEVKVLQQAVALLDVQVARPQVRMHVVPLKHLDAAEAAGALNALVKGSPALWANTSIVAHGKRTLLVAATRVEFARILGLVTDMDRAP